MVLAMLDHLLVFYDYLRASSPAEKTTKGWVRAKILNPDKTDALLVNSLAHQGAKSQHVPDGLHLDAWNKLQLVCDENESRNL